MPSTALQLNQLLSDPALAQNAKKSALNFAALLGNTGQTQVSTVDAFESLLSSILQGGRASPNASVLLGAQTSTSASPTTNVTAPKTGDVSIDDLLKGLPPEIAALLKAQIVAQANGVVLDQSVKGEGILDALSVTPDAGKKPELFAVIDDPELAAILAGLNTQLNVLKGAAIAAPIQGNLQASVLSPTLVEAAEKIKAAIAGLDGKTITIASLNGDEFQALKKIAFSDIAPFLTQPRTIVIDGKHVAKIAQGPAFLNDGTDTDVTVLALNAGLVPVLQPQQVDQIGTNLVPATEIAIAADAGAEIPVLPALSAMLAAKMTNKTSTAMPTEGEGFVATGEVSADAALTIDPKTGAVLPQSNAHKALAAAILSAATANKNDASSDSASRGFGDIISEFAHAVHDPFKLSADGDVSGLLKPQTENASVSATSSLMTARAAGQPHPSTHLVSVALQRNLNPKGEPGSERSFSITLEPGQLGRLKITLQFGEDNSVKAKLIAERPETLSLLQKDVASLDRVLSNNGFDTSAADSFSFDLGGSDSFSQAMHENNHDQGGKSGGSSGDAEFGTESAFIETVIPVFVDPVTGLTHVNVTV
ncbi:MAG TPA: flagellar hook-length control protein FliK [Alphaproteobacteria bacterium]